MTSLEKSQKALELLKESIIEIIKINPQGIGNNDIARALKIESDFEGNQKNYLSWSIIGILVNEGTVTYKKYSNRKLYFLTNHLA